MSETKEDAESPSGPSGTGCDFPDDELEKVVESEGRITSARLEELKKSQALLLAAIAAGESYEAELSRALVNVDSNIHGLDMAHHTLLTMQNEDPSQDHETAGGALAAWTGQDHSQMMLLNRAGVFPCPKGRNRRFESSYFTDDTARSRQIDGGDPRAAPSEPVFPDRSLCPGTDEKRPWTKREEDSLLEAVALKCRHNRLVQLCIHLEDRDEDEFAPVPQDSSAGQSAGVQQVSEAFVTHKVNEINTISRDEVVRDAHNWDTDHWEQVAIETRRSSTDVRLRFLNHLSPVISHAEFSKQEKERIAEGVERFGLHNWQQIASSMEGRTAIQCLRVFQQEMNRDLIKTEWTPADDLELSELFKRHGPRWVDISLRMGSRRTPDQCLSRFKKVLEPSRKRGRWTAEEDELLKNAMNQYGRRWSVVQEHVVGRTDVQCRERWVNVLDPETNKTPWGSDEDQKLRDYMTTRFSAEKPSRPHGSWAAVSEHIGNGRQGHACRNRWNQLERSRKKQLKKNQTRLQSQSELEDTDD